MMKDVLFKSRKGTMKPFASLRAMALLCLVMLSVVGAKAQATAYALWCGDADEPTLVFTCSNEPISVGDNYYDEGDGLRITQVWSGEAVTNVGNDDPVWLNVVQPTAKRILFNSSFSMALPKSTYHWFDGCTRVTAIDGLCYLNTSKVTNMEGMFRNCSGVTSLDLNYFDTRNVTTMKDMFNNCQYLTTLNVSTFNTAKVTDMGNMFCEC